MGKKSKNRFSLIYNHKQLSSKPETETILKWMTKGTILANSSTASTKIPNVHQTVV
eukprot:TRINITY_DN179_c0_g1_i7.p2 TRINITY_DN179_c0_g1~~TRINITY_DN179_c0_g1_i7.p2  ORF type:complete len:56 (+),score=9.63 TRINITY_DN179_c0_g1_i7:604-771(+)